MGEHIELWFTVRNTFVVLSHLYNKNANFENCFMSTLLLDLISFKITKCVFFKYDILQ